MINRTIIGKEIAQQLGVTQDSGQKAADLVFSAIFGALARSEDVRVKGFGTFAVRHLPARDGRNPFNGEKIAIAASVRVTFRPHDALKKALNPQRKVGGARNSPMPQRTHPSTHPSEGP